MKKLINNLQIGDKVTVTHETGIKTSYTVGAKDERFVVLSDMNPEWFNYTIIDKEDGKIGTDDRIISTGYGDYEACRKNLERLNNGQLELSNRNYSELEDVKIVEDN